MRTKHSEQPRLHVLTIPESWLNATALTLQYSVSLSPSIAALVHAASVYTPDTAAQFVGVGLPVTEKAYSTVDTFTPADPGT